MAEITNPLYRDKAPGHSHAIAEITNLLYRGKAPGHSHAIAEITNLLYRDKAPGHSQSPRSRTFFIETKLLATGNGRILGGGGGGCCCCCCGERGVCGIGAQRHMQNVCVQFEGMWLFVKIRLEQLLYIHDEGSYRKTLFPEVGPILIFVDRINWTIGFQLRGRRQKG